MPGLPLPGGRCRSPSPPTTNDMAAFTTVSNHRPSGLTPSPREVAGIVVGVVAVAGLGVLTAGSWMALLLAGGAVVLIVTVAILRQPVLALHVAIWSMWFEGIGGSILSVGRVVAAGLLALVAFKVLVGGVRLRVPPTISWAPALVFIAWAWASGMWSSERGAWFLTTLTMLIGVGYFLIVFLEVQSAQHLWGVFKVWIWIGAGVAVLSGLFGLFTGGVVRVTGLSGGANNYATYVVCALPFLALYFAEAKGRHKIVAAGLFPLYGWGLVVSGSRAGFVGAAVVGAYIVTTFPSESKGIARLGRTLVGIAALVTGLAIAVILNPERFLLLQTAAADRGAGRLDIWNAGLHTLNKVWLFGMGMGQFREQSTTILQQVTGSSLRIGEYVAKEGSDTLDTHNQYLQLWLDLGIIGLGLYLTMIGTALYTLFTKATEEWKRLAWAFVGVLLAVHVALMFMTQINQKFMWVVLGSSAVIATVAARSSSVTGSGDPAGAHAVPPQ